MPTSRSLNSEEERDLERHLLMGLELVPIPAGVEDLDGQDPALLILGIGTLVDAVRSGLPLPEGMNIEDLSTSLGVLYGEELCRCVGWSWVYLVFDDGFEGLGVADAQGGLAILPIHYIFGLLTQSEVDNSIGMLFQMIRDGQTPEVSAGDWRILG